MISKFIEDRYAIIFIINIIFLFYMLLVSKIGLVYKDENVLFSGKYQISQFVVDNQGQVLDPNEKYNILVYKQSEGKVKIIITPQYEKNDEL